MLMFNKTTRLILGLFLLAQGLLLTFGLPPFQKFDETSHFTRTISLSRGQLFCRDRQFIIPKIYAGLHENYNFEKVLLENRKFPPSLINFNQQWTATDYQELVAIGGCRQNFLGYIPNTIGVWLTGWTARPAIIFYSGRLFGFIFLLLMLWLSLKIINKKYDYLLWFFTLMPMVVHQATAYSYDVVIVGLILPLTALWINRFTGHKFSRIHWFWVFLMVAVITIIKPVYLPLFFLFGLKDWNIKFKFKELIVVGLIALLSIGIGRLGKGDGNYPTFVNPKLQLQLVSHDPVYFSKVVITTWTDKFIPHFDEMISIMGWRNTPMINNYLNYVFLILAGLTVWKLSDDLGKKLGFKELFDLSAVIFMVTFLTTAAMYLAWSPVGDKSVEGIQGRYWLPLVTCWLIFVGGLVAQIRQNKFFRNLVLILVLTGVILNIGFSLYSRYFNISKIWVNQLDPKLAAGSLLTVDKEINLIKNVGGRNISGLALNLDNRHKSIIVPYQYFVMDSDCRHIFTRGYLNPWSIQGETQMILEFKPVKIAASQLCLKLKPLNVGGQDYQDRLSIKLAGDIPQMEWLYFAD
jgi:uncharacterized membrane protein